MSLNFLTNYLPSPQKVDGNLCAKSFAGIVVHFLGGDDNVEKVAPSLTVSHLVLVGHHTGWEATGDDFIFGESTHGLVKQASLP